MGERRQVTPEFLGALHLLDALVLNRVQLGVDGQGEFLRRTSGHGHNQSRIAAGRSVTQEPGHAPHLAGIPRRRGATADQAADHNGNHPSHIPVPFS
ncbi:hypothetical protein [Bifidobacterium sp. UBA4282]|uniref:hypothetical protein n=1 Tax=Bifidobacterium sp. UBA4282 TaxID=1946096 RepID=UPI0025BAB38E|nr:hypothetical protein [Bifidobacterium sp. UBA4282]